MKARPPKAPPIPAHPLYEPESDEVVWDGRFPLQRIRFRYRRFDGSLSGPLTWELLRRGDGAIILPYDPWTDRVALIEQFRLPALAAGLDPIMRECPAGMLEPGEDPEAAVRREIEEEAGLVPDKVRPMGNFMPHHGGMDEVLHFFCGRVRLPEPGRAASLGLASENEETQVLVVSATEAFGMLARNEIRNLPCAFSLTWLQAHAPSLRDEWTRE
jgi:ADP-ribose pyrophosphatase